MCKQVIVSVPGYHFQEVEVVVVAVEETAFWCQVVEEQKELEDAHFPLRHVGPQSKHGDIQGTEKTMGSLS